MSYRAIKERRVEVGRGGESRLRRWLVVRRLLGWARREDGVAGVK